MRSRKVSSCLLYEKGQKSIILTGAKMTINAQSRFAEKMTLENIYTHVHSKYLKVYQMKGCSQINSQEIN